MSDLDAFRTSLHDERPDDHGPRLVLADFLDDNGEDNQRSRVLRAACAIHGQIGNLLLPDRYEPFWTPSQGWGAVGERLEALAGHPEDTAAFREQYRQLVLGNVPLDREDLQRTLRLQYDLQVRLLASLNLLNGTHGDHSITAIDGKRYPLPAFDDVLTRMQTPDLQRKLGQGFDTLLLVPFGLPLQRLIQAWEDGLRRERLYVEALTNLNRDDPVWLWPHYRNAPLTYHPRHFTGHGGRTKEDILRQDKRGWDVLLVEGFTEMPREGAGRTIGGRRQIECGQTPEQYLRDLSYGEIGWTPETYIVRFLDALERGGHILDRGSYSYFLGACFPPSRFVPYAYWSSVLGQAGLSGNDLRRRNPNDGARAAVRVG